MAQAGISWSQKCEGPVSSAQSPGVNNHTELCHRLQRSILLSQKRGGNVWRHPGLFSADSQPRANLDQTSLTGLGRSEEIHGHVTTLQIDQLQHLLCDVHVGDVTEGCCLSFLLIF